MLKHIPAAYRDVFLSTLALVVFFLIYLAINTNLAKTTINAAEQQSLILRVTDGGQFTSETTTVSKHVKVFQNGGQLRLSGVNYDVSPIAELAPDNAQALRTVIGHLNAGDVSAATKAFGSLKAEIADSIARKQNMLTVLQIVVALLTILIFMVVTVPLLRRSSSIEITEVQSQDESQRILNTISEGLFLMGSDFEIGIEQSASLKKIFRSERDLEGDFFAFIGQYVTPKTAQVARDYIELLFGQRVKERLVEDLNPLKRVEISISRRDGTMDDRYLDFSFKRVLDGKTMSHLMCTVSDVSREVQLERQLEQAEEENEAQLDLLLSVLHVDAGQLRTFFTSAEEGLNSINSTLEEHTSIHERVAHSDSAIRRKLESIANTAHKLKGDAAILGLNKFEFAAHDFESELEKLQSNQESITGKELLPLVSQLKTLYAEIETMRELVGRFASLLEKNTTPLDNGTGQNEAAAANNVVAITPVVAEETEAETVDTIEPEVQQGEVAFIPLFQREISQLVETVCQRQGKQAVVSYDIEDTEISTLYQTVLRDATVQLVRNSIVHGIETPAAREAAGKAPTGAIKLRLAKAGADLVLSIMDDGAGLNLEAIKSQAAERGLIKASTVLSAKQISTLIFKPGFSSKAEADLDGGRGVGLDIVSKSVKEVGGAIGLGHQPGKACRFSVKLPIAAQ